MLIGYAEVSTKSGGPEDPHQALAAVGCKWISLPSGGWGYLRAQDQLPLRDSLVASRLDRVARSTANLLNGAVELDQKECATVSQTVRIDTGKPSGPLGFTELRIVAQIERYILPECTCAGRISTMKRDKPRGRQPVLDNPDLARQATQILTTGRESKYAVARRPCPAQARLSNWFPSCNPRAFVSRIRVSHWNGPA